MVNAGLETGRFFYHLDALGSVIALSQFNTATQTAQIVERYDYSPFGITTVTQNGNTGNPLRFTARYLDPETGLYDYRARTYKPKIGRFLQPDPTGYADGTNLYAYCGNNPLAYTDPLGLKKNRGIAYAYIDIKTDDGKNNSYKIWNAGEIVDIVNQVAESDKKITYFRYIGHGDEEGGIYWSDSSGLETGLMVRRESWFSDDMYAMDDPDIKDAISRGFSPNAHIDIEACWSAQKGNICESFSDLLPEADVWGYIGKGKYAPGLKMIFPKYWDGARHVRFSKKGCK